MPRIILEFDDLSIRLLSVMIHTYLKHQPESEVGKRLLQDLVEQTNIVSSNPKDHKVGLQTLFFPDNVQYGEWARVMEEAFDSEDLTLWF